MANATETSPANTQAVTQKALGAFWAVVAEAYPEAKTGDLSPSTTLRFDEAAEAAVREWAWANVPEQEADEETPATDEDVEICQDCGIVVEDELQSQHIQGLCDGCVRLRVDTQPELLEACERMKAALDDMLNDDSLGLSSECADLLMQIAALPSGALAEARGRGA
jgi:hypothetical protein